MKNIISLFAFFIIILLPDLTQAQGGNCGSADPFCTGTTYTFPNSTSTTAEVGPDYGCLGSQPNPAWYYLQVANSGNLVLGISQTSNAGSAIDVDFAAYGPFASPVAGCPNGLGAPIDCSFSTAATETANINNAVSGEYYLLLLTNYSGTAGTITLSQTGGTGSTDCNVLNCNITFLDANVSACNAGTFDITGQVEFANQPTTGTLTVSTCSGGQQVFNAPFTSPINYSITGITADATPNCSVTATFSADPACTLTTGTFTEPICTCFMTSFNANIGACDPLANTFDVNGSVDFTDPPSTGTLIVRVDNGTTTYDTIINPPFVGPYNWSISNIPADGSNITISAFFSADPACTLVLNSTAPNGCTCTAIAGTFTGGITGDGLNNYVLCFGDQINLASNGDYTSPGDEGIGGVTYDPGIAYLVYTCPPTVFPTNPLWDPTTGLANDPCLLGVASYGDLFSDANVFGGPSYAGAFTNNTVYYVPITTYSNVDGYYAISINGGPWCYDMGTPFAVQYLPEITTTFVEDCYAGTATITINGGLPELDGSNFTASNLSPATASFGNTTAGNGGTIVINGLQNGDNYSFNIVDNNGCPITFTGGPFVAAPVANAGPDDTQCSLSYPLAAVPSVGTGTWTSSAGVTFSPNANSPTATATVPAAGSYTFTWTENNGGGCVSSDDVIIQFSNLSYVENIVQSTCGNADGSVSLTASNGIPAYLYSIDGGTTMLANGSFTGLMSGSYPVVVEDNIGCQVTGTSVVSDQQGPVINNIVPVNVTCNAACDGSIAINATGATQFSIDNGVTFQAANSFTNLCAGSYDIVVANAIGCQDNSQTTITEPALLSVTTTTTNLVCFGVCTGAINITAAGGSGTLQYSIDNGATFQLNGNFTGLCAGSYAVLVEDANGCQYTGNETLTEPTLLQGTIGSTDETCAGSCDGNVSITVPNGSGTAPYSYQWTGFAPGNNFFGQNLCAGNYSVTVTDNNGCTFTDNVDVLGAPAVTIDQVVVTDELCGGDQQGTITISTSSAVTSYYIVLNGTTIETNTTGVFNGLGAGTYNVYIEDASQCSATDVAVVNGPPSVTVQALGDTTVCINGTATLTSVGAGGVGNYTYTWDNGSATQTINVSPTVPQVYCVTATDGNGCPSAQECVVVNMYSALQVSAFSNQDICEGNTADISAIAQGGIGTPYTYTWNQGVGVGQNQTVSPDQTTVYTVTVEDQCETPSVTADVTITVNPLPIVGFTADIKVGCVPLDVNFTESATIPPGSTCIWNFGDGGISTDCNPSYTFTQEGCWPVQLTVTTPEGCSDSHTETNYICVYGYPTADFIFGPQPTTVLEPTIGFTNLSQGAVDYLWTFDTNGAADTDTEEHPSYTFPNDNPGTYEVCLTSTTAYGCTADTCQDVVIHEEFIVYVPNAFTPDGDAFNNEFIPVVKGIDPLNYEFMVFNRWGELIFEGAHPTLGWDGRYKGVMSQTDVYVWKLKVVEISNHQIHEYIGHVTLLK